MTEVTHIDRLKLDLDTRLLDLWALLDELFDADPETRGLMGQFIRSAYSKGYHDALVEPRGQLYREHGYRLPGRR